MKTLWRRAPGAFIISALLTLVAACAGERQHRDGLAAIEAGDYETGVADLTQAVAQAPNNMQFRLDLQARRDSAVQALVAAGDRSRAAGQFDAAGALYRRALTIDPANDRARRGLDNIEGDKRHTADVQAARKDLEKKDFDAAEAKVRAVLSEEPGFVPAQELASAINGARAPVAVVPHLHPRGNQKVSLQLRDAPTKMVFEVLQRETGINFILDKDVKSDSKTTIFVQDVPVEEAIELVLEQNQLSRNILADNMVMIYPNTAAKQKDYEQQIVRTFYLTNAAPKDVESMLKTVLGAKTLFINEQANMLVMRDTPDAVRMAEKLVASLDVTEPEVMLEVEVLEISSSRLQDLGIQYPTSVTLTPSPVTAATTAAGAAGGLVLADLSHQNSSTIGVSALSLTVNAMKQAGVVNTLASPRIRARNKEKAKVLIGTREPVITNSVTPTAAGAPVVTGSVQYLDVGLTLDVLPTVYLDNDVSIKISLEVSSLLKQVTTASGTIAYEIGTRNASTLLRLKDGETQILAGLIQDSDTRTANTIPLIGEVPILSHLFGTHHTDREKDEIVLSITPRIIRTQPRPAADSTEFWYGSESRLRSRPLFTAEPAGAAAAAGSAAPAAPLPLPSGSPMPGSGPQPINPSVAPGTISAPLSGAPQTGAGLPASASTPEPQGAANMAPPTAIAPVEQSATRSATDTPAPSALAVTGPADAKVGEEFDVEVHISSQEPITHLRSQLRYDSSALKLLSASTGDAVPAAAGEPKVNTVGLGAQLDVQTTSDSPVQGTGTLMTLHFKALAPRGSTQIAAMLNVLGSNGAATGTTSAEPLALTITKPQ